MWSLALAPCSAKADGEAIEESQSRDQRSEVEAVLIGARGSEVELLRSSACDAAQLRESAAGSEFQSVGAWETRYAPRPNYPRASHPEIYPRDRFSYTVSNRIKSSYAERYR